MPTWKGRSWTWPSKDNVLLIGGLIGASWETFHEQVDRPYLLGLFAGMMGLPYWLGKDQAAQQPEPPKPEVKP